MKKLSKNARIALVVVGLLLYAGAGYFLLVSRQGAKAAELKEQVAEVETKISTARIAAKRSEAAKPEPIRIADLFRLSKAMPDQTDMPGVLLELNRVARETGIEFESIVPQPITPLEGYQMMPIDLIFEGSFYDLTDFLFRTRTLVGVRDGELDSRGRLFNVEKIDFAEGEEQFPSIRASLRIEAYVFGAGSTDPAAAAPPPVPVPAPADAAAAAETPAPTEPPAVPEGATAVGATP